MHSSAPWLGSTWSHTKGLIFLTVFSLCFLGAVGSLLWKSHVANGDREALALEQFRWDTTNLASNLEYFFQERQNDLHNLAESRSVEGYFESVALGMSPQYGLLASIQEIEAVFRKLLTDKTLAGTPIFSCIMLTNSSGKVIARFGQNAWSQPGADTSRFSMGPGVSGMSWNLADSGEGGTDLVISHPVAFRDKREGTVSVRLSLNTVVSAMAKDKAGGKQRAHCLAFEDKAVACPPGLFQPVADALRDAAEAVVRLPFPAYAAWSTLSESDALLGTSARVSGTPFTVLSVAPEKALVGSPTWPLLVIIGSLSLGLLVGLALFGRVNAQRMVLNARVEEQTRSESILLKRMEEFTTIFNALPGYAFYKDAQGRYVTANAQFCDAVSMPLTSIVGKRDDEIFPNSLAEGYMRDDQLLLSGRQDFQETEGTILHKGREIQLLTRKLLLRHSDGTLGGLIGLGFDLTEKKHIEEELRSANDRMEERIRQRTRELASANDRMNQEVEERLKAHQAISLILDAISAILIVVDGQGNVIRWSKAAWSTFGMTMDEVTGREFVRLPLAWSWVEITTGIAECRSSGQAVKLANVWYERPDGVDGFLMVTISPLHNDGSEISGYLLLGEDITDVRFLEAQLSQAAKLEAIGQLAAGIAHEINTPTQYVGDSATFLKNVFTDLGRLIAFAEGLQRPDSPCGPETAASMASLLEAIDVEFIKEEAPLAFDHVFDGIERISSIVLAMRRFAYTSGGEKKAVDIRRALENTLVISRNEWKYVAETATDFDPELTDVTCLPGDINQVFLNIIVNAAHAIGDAVRETNDLGLISISTRKDGDIAEIRIKDTGTGIPAEVGNKVFNLFFTTKEVGKGTGQGLAIAYDIVVNKHGGSITFESEPGQGTTFIIRLPIAG